MNNVCRPVDRTEEAAVIATFKGRWTERNRALVVLGINTGFRISELLSINLGDVYQNGRMVPAVTVQKRNTKGKQQGRTMILNKAASAALLPWCKRMTAEGYGPETPLFFGIRRGVKRLRRQHAWQIIHDACEKAGLFGKLGTHTLRKSFADRIYDLLGRDLVRLQAALGHKWVTSTAAYVSFKDKEIDDAVNTIG
jgi:site-specific recombinase XerD